MGQNIQAEGSPNTEAEEVDEYRGDGGGPGLFEAWVRRPVCLEQVRKVAGNEAGARSYGACGHLKTFGLLFSMK